MGVLDRDRVASQGWVLDIDEGVGYARVIGYGWVGTHGLIPLCSIAPLPEHDMHEMHVCQCMKNMSFALLTLT